MYLSSCTYFLFLGSRLQKKRDEEKTKTEKLIEEKHCKKKNDCTDFVQIMLTANVSLDSKFYPKLLKPLKNLEKFILKKLPSLLCRIH